MATINQLLRNPGPYITALLPDIQELVNQNNPYLTNEAASLIWNKMINWGGTRRAVNYKDPLSNRVNRETDLGLSIFNKYPAAGTSRQRQIANSALIKNFGYKLEGLPMAEGNSWLEFQKFVDLFYKMLDPVQFFADVPVCPPSYDPCDCPNACDDNGVYTNWTEYFFSRTGIYKRPMTSSGTEGTGFFIDTLNVGTPSKEAEIAVGYKFPSSVLVTCPPNNIPCFDLTAFAGRYFAFNYDRATDSWDVFWFRVSGDGEEPTYVAGGDVNYIPVDIEKDFTPLEVKDAVEEAVVGTTRWVVDRACPPFGPGSTPPCVWKSVPSTVFQSAAVGRIQEAEDGTDGFEIPVTVMKASDGTTIATELESDIAWQNAHNDLRVPYEKTVLDNDYMYLKRVAGVLNADIGDDDIDDLPCCDEPGSPNPCKACFVFLQTPFLAVIEELPVNVPGVVFDNRTGLNKLLVTN